MKNYIAIVIVIGQTEYEVVRVNIKQQFNAIKNCVKMEERGEGGE